MISQSELKQLLSARFDFEVWKPILDQMFLKIDYLTKEIQIDASLVKSGGQIGTIRLDDGRSLGLFKFEVADRIIIARNRKGLREIAAKYVDQDIIHGALVFYYSTNQPDYRLTFVSKQTIINANGEVEKKETAPKRYTFLLGENEPCATAATRINDIIQSQKKTLPVVTEAFSVERLNREFFTEYYKQYSRFTTYLNSITKSNYKNNRDYVKKLLGRLVFLQFLQKRGWMGVPADVEGWEGGDYAYMSHLIQKYEGNDRIISEVLTPLFFETLNKPRGNSIADKRLGNNIKIPYLNGGLFEKDDNDQRGVNFPYLYFKQLMDFFGSYNFTIDENDPDDAEIGIDPEMLGHIFENLLEDNNEKGAYYTPKEVVQYMCQESISLYLKSHTDNIYHNAINNLIKTGHVDDIFQEKNIARQINQLLKDIKVCDPAIGSGAFPMGILNVLYQARKHLYGFTQLNEDFSPDKIKRDIIQQNIFGVDIEQGAVDIARLRFWLALIIDEQTPTPLPNLDYKIVCGDSLLNRFDMDESIDSVFKEYNKGKNPEEQITLAKYKEIIARYTNADKHEDKEEFKKTIEAIKNAFKSELSKKKLDRILKLKRQVSNNEAPTLFEQTESEAARLKKQKERLAALEQERADIESNKLYESSFEWRFQFPALLDDFGNFTGFDIVIGNPPYLRVQGIKNHNPLYADELVKKYKAATGSYDLYAMFAERGLQIISHKGIVNYIMPVKWTNAAFGKGLRTVVSEKKAAYKIINFGEYQVFDASTYTGLQWFIPNSPYLYYYELDRNILSNQELKEYLNSLSETAATKIDAEELHAGQWTLTAGKLSSLIAEMRKQPRCVKDIFDKIFQGIATSKDDVYFLYNCHLEDGYILGESKQLGRIVKIEAELMKPLLKGENVHRYDKIETDKYVLFPYALTGDKALLYSERELKIKFPRGYDYFKECEDILRKREKGRFNIEGTWFQYGRKQGILMAEKEKLVAPDISLGGNFAYDKEGKFYQTTTIYGYVKKQEVTESYFFWMALLNSRLCWWYLTNIGTTLANGFFRYKPDYINPFPVPAYEKTKEVQYIVDNLVKYLLYLHDESNMNIFSHTSNLRIATHIEEIIDMVIYELYFEEEMKENGIDVISNLDAYSFKETTDSEAIKDFYLWYQSSENTIRQKILLLETRSKDKLYLIHSTATTYEQNQ